MRNIIRLIPLILVYIAIVYFSVKVPSGDPSFFRNIDKLYHFIAYGSLGFAIYLSTSNNKPRLFLLTISLGLGLALEFIQGQLPYRDMSVADGITNILGLFTGVLFFKMLGKFVKIRKR